MINTIIGSKKEMSAVFNPVGRRIPVTAVVVDPNVIVGFKNERAIIGFGKNKKSKKTENAIVRAIGYSPRIIKEVPMLPLTPSQEAPQKEETDKKIKIGDKITVSIFKPGDMVKVTGITRGRGFTGVVKRWGFSGGPKTHGQSDRHRAPGSIGAGTTPGRVFRGKKMAGHMGNARLTITRLEIVDVNEDKNLLLINGSVPGHKNGILIIEKTGEAKKPLMTQTQTEQVPQLPKEKDGQEGEKTATTKNTEEKNENTESDSVNSVVAKGGKDAS